MTKLLKLSTKYWLGAESHNSFTIVKTIFNTPKSAHINIKEERTRHVGKISESHDAFETFKKKFKQQ